MGSEGGLIIEGLSPTQAYKVKFRNKGKIVAGFNFKFDDPTHPDQVVDQGAYNGGFRVLPTGNKCPYKKIEPLQIK